MTFTDDELQALYDAGVRGIRFSFVKRLVDVLPHDTLQEVGERIQAFGMHLVIYVEAPDLPDLCDFFSALPGIIVFDHMGRPDVSKDPQGEEFDLFIRMLEDNENMWAKVSCPDRLSIRRATGLRRCCAVCKARRRDIPRSCALGNGLATPKHEIPHGGRR